ncbi:hypothetical protein EVAR_55283_1 [Eumeta japonica]|uniref:Uncharacterized protein n=1 Tax=Eumeta variegata TaxID=151549 RepID=A0A4C1ZCP9_EUMVA|nr:hypothetical protein EVAR_55283_1 [Eumeta japonica]
MDCESLSAITADPVVQRDNRATTSAKTLSSTDLLCNCNDDDERSEGLLLEPESILVSEFTSCGAHPRVRVYFCERETRRIQGLVYRFTLQGSGQASLWYTPEKIAVPKAWFTESSWVSATRDFTESRDYYNHTQLSVQRWLIAHLCAINHLSILERQASMRATRVYSLAANGHTQLQRVTSSLSPSWLVMRYLIDCRGLMERGVG